MTAKEHYDRHLGRVYSWMVGNFREKMSEQKEYFSRRGITPSAGKVAFDLGAGNGIQSVALATLGFHVRAVDFSEQLLEELNANKQDLPVKTIESDICEFLNSTRETPELVVCMGDTLTHFRDAQELNAVLDRISAILPASGKLVLSWRDLSVERQGTDRFLHVKSDDGRTLTCFLEYLPGHVTVHDVLFEKNSGQWTQTVSSYQKLRIAAAGLKESIRRRSFAIQNEETIRGMLYLLAEKS